jgi:regulator of RNase E activity RraA
MTSKPPGASSPTTPVIAPLSIVLCTRDPATRSRGNILRDPHWVDLTRPGTLVLLQQPKGQTIAVCNGIMAQRMSILRARDVIVTGRVRDVAELGVTALPIWARGTSTVGAGTSSAAWATQVDLDIEDTIASPGDIAFCEPANGVVIIPEDKVTQVLEVLPKADLERQKCQGRRRTGYACLRGSGEKSKQLVIPSKPRYRVWLSHHQFIKNMPSYEGAMHTRYTDQYCQSAEPNSVT